VNHSFTGSVYIRGRARRENIVPHANRDVRRALAQFRRAAMLAGALVLIAPLAAFAQSNAVRARVTDRVDASRLVTLSGNTHPLARAQYDQGAAPPDLPMNRIMLVLKRGADQEAALQDLLEQQQVTSSPTFHKWLTPDQFGQQFGPADADIQAVTSWLASFGFQSIKVSKGRTVIEFSGTASQVETALHAPIHRYVVNGETHWANANDPQILAALAPVVAGFASLHNFPKKAASVRSARTAALTRTSEGKPQITFTDGSHGLGPADFNTIYNIAPTMTGSGVTIGVIARSNIIAQDVADFRSTFNLGGTAPNIILNGPDPGDLGTGEEAEAVLDATWPGAVAPGATVDLVVSESTNADAGEDLSEFYIIDNNLADVMTESFSVCEASFGSSLLGSSGAAQFYSGVAEQAAAQGITYLVSSGDSGPDGCDDPTTLPASPSAASVNLLASTPFTVAVGGTQFNDTASPSTYWNSTSNQTTQASAKSYIPENVWNESCTVAQCGSSLSGLWSSGGGVSIAFPKPSWQAGVAGIPSTNARFLPDVSLTSADHDGYALCLDASCEGSSPGFAILSGTSASAQAFGGIMALVVQKTGARVGIANFSLYKLAATETLSSCNASNVLPALPPANNCIFNDVTSGNTNLTIVGEAGFSAGVGYDEATGLGSVNVTNLVNQWSTAIVDGSTTALTLNGGAAVNVTHGTSVAVGVVVAAKAPATGTPTGDVSLVANSLSGQGADGFTLTNGSASWNTVFLPGGTSYQVKAHYEGDGTFAGSDSAPVTVTVNAEASQTTLGIVVNTPCTLASSFTYGSSYVLSVAVSDTHSAATPCIPAEFGGIPTGGVSVTDTVNGVTSPLDGGNFKLNSNGYFEDQTIQLPVGTHTIKATYVGDNSFAGSNSTTIVTVGQATTTTSVGASPTTVAAGGNVTVTATILAQQSNAIASTSQEPSGTVQFSVNGVAFGSPVPVTGVLNSNVTFAQSVATMSTTALANGQDVISAQYSGDSNYAGSSTTVSVTVTVGSAGINLTPASNTAIINVSALGTPGTQLITVSAAGGFTGTVGLTCAVTTAMTGVTDMPTCSFTSTPTITLTSTTTTGTDTVDFNTTAASSIYVPASRPRGPAPNGFLIGEVCAVLASMFLLGLSAKKRRGVVLLAAAILAVVVVGANCGSSGGNNGGGNPGTTAGAYTVTVTATPSSGAAQSTAIAVIVP
jgi:subtilase family serine protease